MSRKRGICKDYILFGTPKERDFFEILAWIVRKQFFRGWAGLIWLMIGLNDGLLWKAVDHTEPLVSTKAAVFLTG